MEAGKMYSFNIHYKSGIANPPAGDFSITLSKYADFTVPEEPTPTGSGNGYLWNGTGSVTYKTYYAQDLYYKSTLYYVAKDTTFDLSFNAVGYNNNMQIIISGPGYSETYTGTQINKTLTLQAGEYFYITYGSSLPLPTGFNLNVTLTAIA